MTEDPIESAEFSGTPLTLSLFRLSYFPESLDEESEEVAEVEWNIVAESLEDAVAFISEDPPEDVAGHALMSAEWVCSVHGVLVEDEIAVVV